MMRGSKTEKRGLDYDAMRELELYVDNDSKLYHQMTVYIERNLFTKMRSGKYDKAKGPRAWEHLLEAGAKRYAKEFGSSEAEWSKMFPKKERMALAEQYARAFEQTVKDGERSDLEKYLPKKYQKVHR